MGTTPRVMVCTLSEAPPMRAMYQHITALSTDPLQPSTNPRCCPASTPSRSPAACSMHPTARALPPPASPPCTALSPFYKSRTAPLARCLTSLAADHRLYLHTHTPLYNSWSVDSHSICLTRGPCH
eukprot:907651-Prymnesium_polylepis.1